ncbi:MAG: 3-isopropylmalate dehydratase small subunit [Dehalococcoidia bacterium]|nr:3-isopropylmalate dehydratase small subunit [Dehalococcoidia bacterium]
MEAFRKHTGVVAPLDRVNVDTDQIIPKQFLKRIERTGFEDALFFDWRFRADGSPDPDFILNHPGYEGASILVAGRNFGSGSSREHAPWALHDYGFKTVLAPSFADIFRSNCFQNGLLPVELPDQTIALLIASAAAHPGYTLTVDLENNTVSDGEGFSVGFVVDDFRRYRLLNGLDDIAMTLQHEERIAAYEEKATAAV